MLFLLAAIGLGVSSPTSSQNAEVPGGEVAEFLGRMVTKRLVGVTAINMSPTLQSGDYVFFDRLYSSEAKKRLKSGTIILFINPHDDGRRWVKRIVAREGQTVQMIGGILHIDGEPLPRSPSAWTDVDSLDVRWSTNAQRQTVIETLPSGFRYEIIETAGRLGRLDETGQFFVPPEHYFVMGDNRDNSADSRTPLVQFVSYTNIVGIAHSISHSATDENRKKLPIAQPER